MALASGSKFGPYDIVQPLGAGGMGEVYRARDSKLGRDVALKVLPDIFARDFERMARFAREAKVLAALDHSNIASIYGLEDSGNTHALVMQLAEGPTLADRIAQGPIPLEDALRIAKQICEALEYAHEKGIVHRDLKPANIKVAADGTVKVLDFGLAKAMDTEMTPQDISNSPTLSRMATQAGVLLGTAAYMSPEQAKGKSVDRRADIWAFGCVLYEMLTGKMAFPGETVTDTLAAVIRADPDWSQLPRATPTPVQTLLQRCLQKDPKQRIQAIGDARISIDEILSGAAEAAQVRGATVPVWRSVMPWSVAALLFIALASLAFVYFGETRTAPAGPVRFTIPLSQAKTSTLTIPFGVSPDGRQLAFEAEGTDGRYGLWIRSLDSLEAHPLSGAEFSSNDVSISFWSPDSRYIAFSDSGELKKVDVSGGPPQTLCGITGILLGGAWNSDGVIVFATARGGPTGLMQVSDNGGTATPVTSVDSSRKETFHGFPVFLPDGRHFLYLRGSDAPENSGIYVGSLDAKPSEQSLNRLWANTSQPAYVPPSDGRPGYILFVRDRVLVAQPFDARRLEPTGEPVPLAEQLGSFQRYGYFSASTNGVVVYRTGLGGISHLTWFDRQGRVLGTAGDPGAYDTISLSPDGTRAVVSRSDDPSNPSTETLWLVDFSRGTSTRFTFGSSSAILGAWSPDGSRIIYGSRSAGEYDLYQKLASGVTGEDVLLKSTDDKWLTDWSRDGRFLLYQSTGQAAKGAKEDLWVLPLDGDKTPFLFEGTGSSSDNGHFSPDGHLIAYSSDESGRNEVYVRTFSPATAATSGNTGGKWLISTTGGNEPRWRGDGKELYYIAPDGMLMAVDISESPVFRAGVPKALFQSPPYSGYVSENHWDVTRDGQRFLFAEQNIQAPFTVVLNWPSLLKK
ncbi:MAG TPA: protein kinase [Candidatus Baltobacteraceae bacterium]|nr:protein kinase [Candidatus Baltobacteraceae bacterium]